MRPQATGSNTLGWSIIFPSVCPPGRLWVFYNFGIYIDFQCGGPASRCIYINLQCGGPELLRIYTHTGVQRTTVRSSWAYVYVSLSISLSSCLRQFLAIICAERNCVQSIQLQATGSNPLSGSIIFSSIHPPSRLRTFCYFLVVLIYCVGVKRRDAFLTNHQNEQ